MLPCKQISLYRRVIRKVEVGALCALFMFSLSGFSDTKQAQRCHPAVRAFFESRDPFVRDVVIPNIDANRRSDITLQFVSEDGTSLEGCNVSVELKKHQFQFGHCDLATERDRRAQELLNELFDFTCPQNITKWRACAPAEGVYDFSAVDKALDFCEKNDVDFEWHFLSGYHPKWLNSIESDDQKARLQEDFGREVLKRYHNKIRFFQVFNEDWFTHIERAKVYTDQTAYFAELKQAFPEVPMGVCDCWSYNVEGRLPDIDTLTKKYPGIDFISMHAHKPRQLWASPKEMYETYDPYLDSGVKVHVTEFAIIKGEISGTYQSGEWNDDNLAEYFVQAMATAFSHKAVDVFNLWSGYDTFTGNRLFSEEGVPNAKYFALQSLLQDALTTRVSRKTNRNGECAFRGFHGSYDITIELPSGEQMLIPLEADADSKDFKLIVDTAEDCPAGFKLVKTTR